MRTAAFIVRWAGRLGSIASLGMLALFATDSPDGLLHLGGQEAALFACFPVGIALGMILGWWRELAGGLLTIASLAAFYIIYAALRHDVPTGPWFAIFASPGALMALSGVLHLARPNRRSGGGPIATA